MTTIHSTLVLAALAFGAFSLPATAKAEQVAPRVGSFCLMGDAEEHCGFTSYAQCQASASGTGGECTVDLSANLRARG